MKRSGRGLAWWQVGLMALTTGMTMALCVCLGSVSIPLGETLETIGLALLGRPQQGQTASIVLSIRLPRVLCTALVGASLALCGGAMQGLLRNPLADGSTMGVSSGAALGAVVAMMLGLSFPGFALGATVALAMLFAFVSLILILSFTYLLDSSLSTNTIILTGVIFSMFASSMMSLLITFSGDKLKSITFWTMGSLAGSSYENALVLAVALLACGGLLLGLSRELNAFAVGEDHARHLGVNVRGVKLAVLGAVSVLIGVSVSIGGTIGFVGLVVPHILRMITGPNHARLLPATLFGGATFLCLSDLCGRMILRPIELPIGVITSLVGSVVFAVVFYRTRRAGQGSC